MTRRRHLGPLLAALFVSTPAAAQEAAERAEAPAAAAPAPRPARKPRRPQRQARQQRRGAAEDVQQQAAPDPAPGPRLEAAPVPNRDLEAPRASGNGTDRARLAPSVIHRRLPGQGMASEGAANIQEERLFFPAPGARLNVPFSY